MNYQRMMQRDHIKNKLLIWIIKRRKIFFIIILLLILLAGGIRILECYHKDFLFKQVVMNEYFKAGLVRMGFYYFRPPFYVNEDENFYESLLTTLSTIWKKEEIYNCIMSSLFFIKHYFFGNYYVDYKTVYIEEIKSPFFKKHILYRVLAYPLPDECWVYVAAVDIDRFKVHEIENDYRSISRIRIDQKVIKNFNKLIVKEKISINSCEDCLELIKTLFELTYREHLIKNLIGSGEYIFKVFCYGHPEPIKKAHRETPIFIFKPYKGADYYYVELYIPEIQAIIPDMFIIKDTFKVKKNGVIYDFNEIVFGPLRELRAVEE